MTFAAGGTLYFADSMNNRVRAISPDGTIRTVAGTGKDGWVESGTPAADADIGAPADVTFSPDHRLYVAVAGRSEILRLDPDRRLVRVTGVRRAAGVYGVGRPATRASADGPESLAFDGAGDLFVQGFNTKTLLMISPAGTMKLPAGIGSDYPTSGGLASLPGGRIVATNRTSILELSPHGARTLIDFGKLRIDGIRGFSAEGIATDRSGDLYVDTWPTGYANTNTVALVEIHPDRSTRVLWKSR
jgi:sugar lactone lactonase YvrE